MDTPFPSYKGNAPYIFVSYAQDDKKEVFKHIKRLNQEGFRIWYDEGIEPGVNWYESLEERLRGCECILLFMSKHSQKSKYISKEITFAIENNKHIVCVMLDDETLKGPFKLMLCDTQSILKDEIKHVERFYCKLKNSLHPELTCTESNKNSNYKIDNKHFFDKNNCTNIRQNKIVIALLGILLCTAILFFFYNKLTSQNDSNSKSTTQETNKIIESNDKAISSLVLATCNLPIPQKFNNIEATLDEVCKQEFQFMDFIEQNKQAIDVFKLFVLYIDNIYDYLINHHNKKLTKSQTDNYLKALTPVCSINKKIEDADSVIDKLFKKTDIINKKLTSEQKKFFFTRIASLCLTACSSPELSKEQCIAKYEEYYGGKYVFNEIDFKESILSFFDIYYCLNKIFYDFKIYYEEKYKYIRELNFIFKKE